MKTYLFDCIYTGESVFIPCGSWDEAELAADEHDLELVGEYVETQPGPLWLTHGETKQ